MHASVGSVAMKTIADRIFSSFNRKNQSFLPDFRNLLRTGLIYDLPVQKLATLVNLSLNDERSVMLCTLLAMGILEDQALTNINVTASLSNMLINACKARDWTFVEYLLETGAQFKVNSRLRELLSQLQYDADHVVELILTRCKGFEVNSVDETGAFSNGETLLMMACSLRLVRSIEVLLHTGADVNQQDRSGLTALHHVAMGLRILSRYSVGFAFEVVKVQQILRILLHAGADPTVMNHHKTTAAMLFKKELRQDELARMLEAPDNLSPLSSSYMQMDDSPGLY